MRFKMERRAPCALAVQAAAIVAGLATVLAEQLTPLPPPAPCDGAAQIVYDRGHTCHAGLDGLFDALAAARRPGFVRAVYVRDSTAGAAGTWLGAQRAAYLWRPAGAESTKPLPPGRLAAYAGPAQARAAGAREGGQVLAYHDVVELTVQLVTKD